MGSDALVECSCGGTNENCYKCGTGIAPAPERRRPGSPPRAKATFACPVCGVLTSRVVRHLRRTHGISDLEAYMRSKAE